MLFFALFPLLAAASAQYAMPLVGTQLGYAAAPMYTTYSDMSPALGYGYGYGYGATMPLAFRSAAVPVAMRAMPMAVNAAAVQSHAQDELGQYDYGYATGTSAKKEMKTADGVVRGSYSYLAADGTVQQVNYIADALGYRVLDNAMPVATAVLTRRKRGLAYAAPYAAAVPAAAPIYTAGTRYAYPEFAIAPTVGYAAAPAAIGYAAPVARYAAAAPAAVGYAAPTTAGVQHHTQDELGQYNYGYAGVNSAKKEVKTADGVVRGSYSYVDANGQTQLVNYISDALGFRVQATNLPVAPVRG